MASVLIVGAGPTGLVLALALAQNGITVRIIDKLSEYRVGRKGHGIQPRTIELHKFLGTLEDFQKLAGPPPVMTIYRLPGGTEPAKQNQLFPQKQPSPSVPFPNLRTLGQDKHEEILRAHLAKHGVFVERGTQLLSFEQLQDRVITHLATHSGEKETVEFKWLVGTDGAHSVIRKGLDIPFEGETRDSEYVITGDIRVTSKLSRENWHMWGDFTTKYVDLLPSEDPNADLFTFHLSGSDPDLVRDKEKIAASRELLIKETYAISGRTDIEFGDLVCMSLWKPNVRMTPHFGQGIGRVFIAGDAGHTHSPTGGQGLNSCFHDAVNLAWKLALVERNLSPHTLLASYSDERVPIIATMLSKTTELLKKRFTKAPNDGSAFTRGEEANQLGVNYAGSKVVVDDFAPSQVTYDPYGAGLAGGPLRAGFRAPDAPGLIDVWGKAHRLFDLFKLSHHTVLVFSTEEKVLRDVLSMFQKYPKEIFVVVGVLPKDSVLAEENVVVDSEGYAYQSYASVRSEGEAGPVIVVVRPDSFVGAIVGTVDGLKRYLDIVFV